MTDLTRRKTVKTTDFNDSSHMSLSCDKNLKSIPLLGLTVKDLAPLMRLDDMDLESISPENRTIFQKILLR